MLGDEVEVSISGSEDVVLSSPQNNQALLYNSGTLKWVNANLPSGGGGGNSIGWIAAANAPANIKSAILAGGGLVCDGTADQVEFASALAAYKHVCFTEGNYYFSATLTIPGRTWLQGSGPSSQIIGASGLSGAFISITNEHTILTDFTLSGGTESAGTHHIDANITSNAGFWTGEDACTVIERIISRNAKGDGIRMTGTYNRDSKLSKNHVWNATGNGFFLSTADGSVDQCIAGTCGGNGIETSSTSANWRITNSKAWYSDGDGFRIDGGRHTLSAVEGQDNDWAGIRIIADITTISGWLADSNSNGSGGSTAGVHSGLEIGRLETGASNGGYDISVGPGQSWDKNEGSRGFQQLHGVRLRSGIRGLVMTGVQTGNPTSNFKNVTGGIVFDTPSDLTHANNYVSGCMNHYVRMSSV